MKFDYLFVTVFRCTDMFCTHKTQVLPIEHVHTKYQNNNFEEIDVYVLCRNA